MRFLSLTPDPTPMKGMELLACPRVPVWWLQPTSFQPHRTDDDDDDDDATTCFLKTGLSLLSLYLDVSHLLIISTVVFHVHL